MKELQDQAYNMMIIIDDDENRDLATATAWIKQQKKSFK